MEGEILIRATLSLVFVVALIGLIAFAFQKFAVEKKLMRKASDKKFKVLEYQIIDAKRRVARVGYKDKEIVILLSPNGEQVISESQMVNAEKKPKKKS